MVLVKKSLALHEKNGIIADGTAAIWRAGGIKLDNKKGRIAAPAPTKKGPDRGQVQLSFASVILSWKEVKRRVVMFRHQSHKGRLDILNQGEGLSPIAYRRCSGS